MLMKSIRKCWSAKCIRCGKYKNFYFAGAKDETQKKENLIAFLNKHGWKITAQYALCDECVE